MNIKAAIFDLDGTLIDSMPMWQGVGEEYLLSIGIKPRENLDKALETFTFEQSAEYFRENYDVALTTEEMVEGMNKIISERYKTDVALKPGVGELLKRLSSCGVKMCVATSASRDHAMSALAWLGVLGCFSGIFICSELDCNKTVPTVYRAALAHLGTKREETAVFEDTLYALQTAKNDGFVTVAVYDTWEKEQEAMKNTADYYVTDLSAFDF